jgi:hypothetical protein
MIGAQMLEHLTASDFSPHVGDRFRLHVDDDTTRDVELIEVEEGDPAGHGRAPFSLVFRGPTEPILPQQIYRFDHGELGTLEIFIVPIGTDEDGVRYEAVFT